MENKKGVWDRLADYGKSVTRSGKSHTCYVDNPYPKELVKAIDETLKALQPKERAILRLRYALEDGQFRPMWLVGRLLDLSTERVRQIEARALRKLRSPLMRKKMQEAIEEYESISERYSNS